MKIRISNFEFPLLLLLFAALAPAAVATPWDALEHRSISRSHQFVVYASDPNARAQISMAAEDAKDKLLELLNTDDDWKRPIVIVLNPSDTDDPALPPSDVHLIDTEDGFKIELDIVLGDDPRAARFPEQIMRCLLLEYAYRNQPALVEPGATYAEPPGWLVDGFATLAADPDPSDVSELFRGLIQSGNTPSIAEFLSENPATIDDTPSRHLYSACSMSLVRLLLGLPDGPARMRDFIRHLPGPNSDPQAELLKAFPALNSGGQSLDKWWTLGLASLSAADRYEGLSLDETSQQLDALLKFDVVVDKSGKTKSFTLDQYPAFRNAPGAPAALNILGIRLLGLEAQGNPLMREVVGAYQDLAVQLSHRKSSHLQEHLATLADYRQKLLARMDQIADYLNWYEATQRTQASGAFDEYVHTADQLDTSDDTDPNRSDPISKYMDAMEQELAQ
ncbi:MAG: hypothetical protein ABSE62_13005 [Chthoniobacteraceae bacterium]|jgi:hypothetical protein